MPTLSVAIRSRTPPDLPACVGVLRRVHEREGYPFVWPDDPVRWVAGRDVMAAWVAEQQGTVIGHVLLVHPAGPALRVWEAGTGLPAERLAVVSRLFVGMEHRCSGAGGALLATAVSEAQRRRLQPVLDVLVHNQAACRLYESRSWQRLGRFDWDMPDGSTQPAYAYTVA